MTTLNSLGSAEPEPSEVAHASLAMADYDAKGGNYATALDWLAVAAQFRVLTPEYRHKKVAWEFALEPSEDASSSALACAGVVRRRAGRR
jgi:hypothetical protein